MYRYRNPYDFTEVAQDALTLPMSYVNGMEVGQAMGYDSNTQKKFGTIELLNNTMRFGAKNIQEVRRRKEQNERFRKADFDSYQNVDNDYYDTYNPFLNAQQTDRFKYGGLQEYGNGGKLNPMKSNKIIQALKPIYEYNQPLKNSSNKRDFANLWGFQPAQEILEGRNKSDKKVKPFVKTKLPPPERGTEYRYYKHNPESSSSYTKGGTHISADGYYSNPLADNYIVPTDGNITMKDVPKAMMGTSMDTGESKLMLPNQDYFFKNTTRVFEQPLKTQTLPKFKMKK